MQKNNDAFVQPDLEHIRFLPKNFDDAQDPVLHAIG